MNKLLIIQQEMNCQLNVDWIIEIIISISIRRQFDDLFLIE